jgi:hypothetical protein
MLPRVPADRASCQLLRAVVCRSKSADSDRLRSLTHDIRDWDAFLDLAEDHRVSPIVYTRLGDVGPAVPTFAQERLRVAYERNAFRNLANAAELISVLKAFERENIPAMPFKGVVLGASVYRSLTTRPAGDLDLLVDYNHVPRATAVLLERGYEFYPQTELRPDAILPPPDRCGECHLERHADGMIIELHWGLGFAERHFRCDLGMDWIWPRRQIAFVAGADVPNMSPEITLLVLCMHGSKHVWGRLIWICDVAQLLDSSPELDWQEVLREAKRTGLTRILAFGVLLAHRVAEAPVPPAVLRRFESESTASYLAKHVEENLFDSPGSKPANRIPYSVQLLGFRDRASFFLSSSFLQPTHRDHEALPLPKPLHSLYYLLRPFRILWDKSPR